MAVDGSTDSRPNHLVVVGASAGGINALIALASALEPDVDAAVLVVLHMGATARTVLDQVMSRAGPLPARLAVHGEPIRRAEILIAPPDHHLLVDDGTVRLTRGPRIGGLRPSVDELFRSAASSAGAGCA